MTKVNLFQAAGIISGTASTVALVTTFLFQTFITRTDLAPIEVKLTEMDRRLEQRSKFTDEQMQEIKRRLDQFLTSRSDETGRSLVYRNKSGEFRR